MEKRNADMFLKAVFPGKYIQGEGALDELPCLIRLLGKNGLILASRTVKDKILAAKAQELATEKIAIAAFQGECCEKELNRLAGIISRTFDPQRTCCAV